MLPPQLLHELHELELLFCDNINSSSNRKLELVFRSVSVAVDSIDINKINNTSLENIITSFNIFGCCHNFIIYM